MRASQKWLAQNYLSSFSPVATIFNAPSSSGRCSFNASSCGASGGVRRRDSARRKCHPSTARWGPKSDRSRNTARHQNIDYMKHHPSPKGGDRSLAVRFWKASPSMSMICWRTPEYAFRGGAQAGAGGIRFSIHQKPAQDQPLHVRRRSGYEVAGGHVTLVARSYIFEQVGQSLQQCMRRTMQFGPQLAGRDIIGRPHCACGTTMWLVSIEPADCARERCA